MSDNDNWPEHINGIMNNREEIQKILDIHSKIGGEGPGRRKDIEILNRSAIEG